MFLQNEIEFLRHHRINIDDDVLDARYLTTSEYKVKAKAQQKDVVLSSTPCQKLGHRLRTRYGHCLQCDIKKIVHLKRYNKIGYVYLAYSNTGKIAKIGLTNDLIQRQDSLNLNTHDNSGYAGYDDWKIIVHTEEVTNSGRIEHTIQNHFLEYSCERSYTREGRVQIAYEVFDIELNEAIKIFKNN